MGIGFGFGADEEDELDDRQLALPFTVRCFSKAPTPPQSEPSRSPRRFSKKTYPVQYINLDTKEITTKQVHLDITPQVHPADKSQLSPLPTEAQVASLAERDSVETLAAGHGLNQALVTAVLREDVRRGPGTPIHSQFDEDDFGSTAFTD